MMKVKNQFVCQQCGYTQSQWAGKCPNCGEWNSLVETVFEAANANSKTQNKFKSQMFKLSEVAAEEKRRLPTNEPELDSVLGGGLVSGMMVLLAGEPGIGKSTLLTQTAMELGLVGKVVYVCGEESASQVVLRVKRLQGAKAKTNRDIKLLESTDVDDIVAKITEEKPLAAIVDSIQTLTTADLSGGAGSVGQVRECAARLTAMAKSTGIPVFLVGHVTKDGSIAGPRVLEHVVDTVLWFEGERSQTLRVVRAIKNRFGPTDEVGVFEMSEAGLVGVSDPSRLLLSEKVNDVPGSVVSVVLEGKRPMLVEIQALTNPSQLVVPRRVATGVDNARMQMLVAVLMRRANLHLENTDIFVNVTGGIKLADRGIDLAVCLAIASAFLNKSLPSDIAAVGEVGLLGEVRKVTSLERRVKEAKKMGFRVASAESGKNVSAAIAKLVKG